MDPLHEITVEFLLDCSQPMLCDCLSCDDARRARVQAFVTRWTAQNRECEESGVKTVRPPAFRKAA